MTRWLNWNDLIAIQQLQRRGLDLDRERAVLWPHSPLHAALSAHLPYSHIAADTIILYPPARRGRALGFLQLRPRQNRPAADISYIAPALDAREDAVSIWYRLLAECSQHVGERGGQRLFVQAEGNNATEEVLRQAGFTTYAHEDVYRMTDRPSNLKRTHLLRHQRSRDSWNILRLYTQTTPRPVQIAEGMLSLEGHGGRMRDWWDQTRGSGYILQVDHEVAGALRIQRGSAAFWLRFWLHPQAREYGETLVHEAISLLWAAPKRPIYASVRDYESGLQQPLEDAGFQYLYTRSLLVKHTTVRVKEPLLKLVPALENRPEASTSIVRPAELADVIRQT